MLTPLNFKLMPLPASYLKQMAALLSHAAYIRENSFDRVSWLYYLTIAEAVKQAAVDQSADDNMALIASLCLRGCWNECMDFIKDEGLTPPGSRSH